MAQGVEPRVAIIAVAVSSFGPIAAEVSMLAAAGIVGGAVAVYFDKDGGFGRALKTFTISLSLALLLGGSAAQVVAATPYAKGLEVSALWPVMGFLIAALWKPGVEFARAFMKRGKG